MSKSNQVCMDSVRSYLYDNLTSYFLREDTFVQGTCETCGANDVEVNADKPGGTGKCRGQLALTQKRHTAAEGHPVAFGSPLKDADRRGYFSMTDTNATILVSDEMAIFVGKVVPSSPTPASVAIRPDLDLGKLLDQVLASPPDRYVVGFFDKKSDMPMRFSSAGEIVINGKQTPIRLDRARLGQLVALISEFGAAEVDKARAFRTTKDIDPAKASADAKKIPAGLLDRIRVVPLGDEPEYEYARLILKSRAPSVNA